MPRKSTTATGVGLIAPGSGGVAQPPVSARIKERCRRFVARGLFHAGLLRGAQRLARTYELGYTAGSRLPRLGRSPAPKFGILCYHRVGTEGIPLFSRLQPRVFEMQMRYLRRHYRIVSLGQLCHELREACPVEPTLAITFDDGYRDLYSHAFPVLQKYEIPATVYLIGQCVETGEVPWYDRIFAALKAAPGVLLELHTDGPRRFELSSRVARAQAAWEIVCYLRTLPDARRRQWCADFERRLPAPQGELQGRMLDWSRVLEMHRGGVFFGVHTMTHPSVSKVDAAGLEKELNDSRKIVEARLGTSAEDFSYPFGKPADCSLAAEEFLTRAGYRSAVTTTEGVNLPNTNLLRLRRLQIGDDPSLCVFAFNLSRMFLASTSGPLMNSEFTNCENTAAQLDAERGAS
jgi:peptidoglycan/xylan/chitin deacetylase (PgdA/CDA1 family)